MNLPPKKYSPHPTAYGGRLRNTRAGRRGPRTLSTKRSIHLVLRTSRIVKAWSFNRPQHRDRVRKIVIKHAERNNISIIGYANVGNHLHLHLKVTHRSGYLRFIRAVTSAIMLAVTGISKNKNLSAAQQEQKLTTSPKFWLHRPYTVVVTTFRHLQRMKDYILVNQLEGQGFDRASAYNELAYLWDRKMMRMQV